MKTSTHRWFNLAAALLLAVLLFSLAACEAIKSLDFPWEEPAGVPTKTPVLPTPTATLKISPTPEATEITPTAISRETRLVLWLPPEFDPEADNEAARLLKSRLQRFARANAIEVDVRLKSSTGSSNVIESLITTSGAAPDNLPALALLRKQDLDSAYARGLVYSNEALLTLANSLDLYGFAREAVSFDGESFGIGLFGDPLIMTYQARSNQAPNDDWYAIHENFGRLGFAADDPQGRFLLLLYLAAGGETRDTQNHLILQKEPLERALQVLKDTAEAQHMSPAVPEMQTSSAVWQGFAEWRLDTAVMPASVVLKMTSSDLTGYPEPAFTQPAFSLTEAWVLAITNPNEAQQTLAIKLIQELSDTSFLTKWSEALNYVPALPVALGSWTNVTLKPSLEKTMNVARLYPRDETINSLGPVLRNATLMIVRDGASVEEALEQALESIK